MGETKEKIKEVALRLFAARGYEAVFVSDIAGELSLAKSALYRHFENKRAILTELLSEADFSSSATETPHSFEELEAWGMRLFERFTTGNTAALRRLLTVSQYADKELSALYRRYLIEAPLNTLEGFFADCTPARRRSLAVSFLSPLLFWAGEADREGSAATQKEQVREHLRLFSLSLQLPEEKTEREKLLAVASAVYACRKYPRNEG